MKSDIVLMRKDIKDNYESLQITLESIKSEISTSIIEIKNQTNHNITIIKNEITSSFKKLNDFYLFGLQSNIPFGIQKNLHLFKFNVSGLSYVYNKPYNHKTASYVLEVVIAQMMSY
jgi:hypothetical protein